MTIQQNPNLSPGPAGAADESLAVLISGGLDSAILLGDCLKRHREVHPLYVRAGLIWEAVELEYLQRFLHALESPGLRPLTILDMPVRDVYGPLWCLTGQKVPDAQSPDSAVFLPGRNVLLLSKALLWCHLHGVPGVALGTLASNPFPDATPGFFQAFGEIVNRALGSRVAIVCPFGQRSKAAVMRLGQGLPLEWTFSCIHPRDQRHCGVCNKCAERRQAFRSAKMPDPTDYVAEAPCTA